MYMKHNQHLAIFKSKSNASSVSSICIIVDGEFQCFQL